MDYKADLKKLRKYETRLFYEMSECGMSVRGYPLTFDDFPGFKFFIHRNNKGNSYWEVSDMGMLNNKICLPNRKLMV